MRRALIPLALAASVFGSVASAQLSQTYKDFPTGPAGFIMTDAEKKGYALLKSDAGAQAWIELFWAKRDPDLNTVENEFKQDFDQRVAAADKMFSTDKVKGSVSDRGKVLILMGKPLNVRNQAAGEEEEEGNRPGFIERGATQIWMFTKDGNPAAKKADAILFVFSETRPGMGDFLLDRSDRRNKQSQKVLVARVDDLVKNPKLTEVPRVGLLPGTKAATSSQQAVFDVQPRPWPEHGGAILTASGVKSENSHPIWVWVQLPDSSPPANQATGRLRKADGGDVVGSFVSPVTPISVPGARAYEFSLPAEAGAWKVDLALSNDVGPVAVATVDAKSEPAPADGPYISPIYWGADPRQAGPQVRLGDAFHLGAMQLIPRVDANYKTDESITYAAYVVRPTLTGEQKPTIELRVVLFSGGKEQDKQEFQSIDGVKVVGDLWVFGQRLPLSGFRRGTQFDIEVTLRDAKTGVSSSAKIPFTVVKDEQSAAAQTPVAPPK
ncbi:MAG: GWxTD domain-containing protein [Acidobacteriia bacterium]|nr:GWxTD domain-containing protein [Terriglobia bacterium]